MLNLAGLNITMMEVFRQLKPILVQTGNFDESQIDT
jgi:hypothetical protein